jgi:hypothetical protein
MNDDSFDLHQALYDRDIDLTWSYDSEIGLTATVYTEPTTYNGARRAPDSVKWDTAMKIELEMLKKNDTYELVPLPAGRKSIGVKWVYKIKLNPDNSINKYKARLVAKGFFQRQGINFHETYAPVAKMASIRLLLALKDSW